MVHNEGGYIIAVNLQGDRIKHLANWLAGRGIQAYPGNCMEWLPNAEVAPNKPLFHELGIHRSKDGPNMKAKIIHAANACVEVVGVFVNDAASFNTMTNEQLLGNPPASGVEDAAR
jgi:hypothetical protein